MSHHLSRVGMRYSQSNHKSSVGNIIYEHAQKEEFHSKYVYFTPVPC